MEWILLFQGTCTSMSVCTPCKFVRCLFVGVSTQIKLNLSLDVVLNLSRKTQLRSLPELFISGMCSQLRRMGSVIKEFSEVMMSSY